ncbi:cytochrome-c peroxidase [Myroides guanonis]|uniref:Methylamine utilization protein MauG n=1 Tax=Myroides guanonis TaxID=1150112 RepID=A0A1I3RUM7_9FLAO|nr:cytochrome c peroxidase [Myroides guanonis]SFJ49612.1 cytochrome c peroxidase [Myroides guanonis]
MKKTVGLLTLITAFGLLSFAPLDQILNFNEPEYQSIIENYKKPISQWPQPTIDEGINWKEMASIPQDTHYFKTQDLPKVQLGKLLFFDPRLSKSNQISCSNCHDPEIGWTDKRKVAMGTDHLMGTRNTPSLFNIANRKIFFWDGRATSLEEQAHSPLTAHNEMAMDVAELPNKLNKIEGYKPYFEKAYGDGEITYERIVKALASFQRTIKSQPSRVDKFIDGNHKALNDQEIYGMHIFRTKGRCMNCHHGQDLTDDEFHNIGLTYYKRQYEDLGRFTITKDPEDVGKFKTPSLRDLLNTRPWMHNGLFDDLEGIVNIYNSGMHMIDPSPEKKLADPLYPVTDSLLKPLELTKDEKKSLVAFLEALSGTRYKMKRPDFPKE